MSEAKVVCPKCGKGFAKEVPAKHGWMNAAGKVINCALATEADVREYKKFWEEFLKKRAASRG